MVGNQVEGILEEEAVNLIGAIGNHGLKGAGVIPFDTAETQAGCDIVAFTKAGFVLYGGIQSLVGKMQPILVVCGVIIIQLQRKAFMTAHAVLPGAEEVAAVLIEIRVFFQDIGSCGQPIGKDDLITPIAVDVTLQGPLVAVADRAIGTETGLDGVPAILGILAAASQLVAGPVVAHGVETGEGGLADLAAIAGRTLQLFLITRPGTEQASLGILGFFGDDVDHPVDRVGAPDGAARTTDHLDPVDVFEHGVLGIPEHAAVGR